MMTVDHHLNFLFRLEDMQVFWAEPSNVHKIRRSAYRCRGATSDLRCEDDMNPDPCALRPGYCPPGRETAPTQPQPPAAAGG